MRKSRVLTLILTVVFILANVAVPSFAADISYTHGNPADSVPKTDIIGPIGNLPFHVSHKVDVDGAKYGLSKTEPTGVSVSDDGILTITSAASPMKTGNSPNASLSANVAIKDSADAAIANGPTVGLIYAGYNFPFDDDIDPGAYGLQNNGRYVVKKGSCTIVTDTDGVNKYAELASGAYIGSESVLLHKKVTSPYVLEMDLKGLTGNIALTPSSGPAFEGATFLKLNASYGIDASWAASKTTEVNSAFISDFNANDGEWHNYKWVIIPSKYTKADGTSVASKYDLYIDDHMVVKGVLLTEIGDNELQQSGNSKNHFVPLPATALDNLKRYGTSLGFAHDVTLSADNNTVGSAFTYSADIAHMPTSNIREALECAVVVSDTPNGQYTELATGLPANGSYTIPESAKGKYLKVAARVVETVGDQCATGWVLSDEPLYVSDGAIVNDPAIDSVSLSVNGASCADLEAENILTDANIEAGTADIAISISASSESGKTVKFVLAQYNKVEGVSILKNVAVSDVELTSTGAPCDLSLIASGLNANTEFKLFALTADGLVPVDLINLQ